VAAPGRALSEDEWKARVIDTAKVFGWRICHVRPARTAHGWRTPYEGHSGLPDLILARRGVVLLAELKTDTDKPTLDQQAWLDSAGSQGYLWRPCDWDQVRQILQYR
jgi:hypothetical protein